MRNKFKGYVYKITNKVNNKFYIGQTRVSIEHRFKQHIKRSSEPKKYNSHLYEAMRKYGVENFFIEIVEEVNTSLDDLYEREKYWIKYLDARNTFIGYNIDEGGRGGDVIHLLSKDKRDEINNKIRLQNLGKHQSRETINKRVEKNKDRKVVTKNNITKHVSIDELQQYLDLGWKLGRREIDIEKSLLWQKDKNKLKQVSQKISQKMKGKCKGYIRMVNSENNRVYIPKSLEKEYLNLGYVRGFGKVKR